MEIAGRFRAAWARLALPITRSLAYGQRVEDVDKGLWGGMGKSR